jgi:hypothetical protein
MITEGARRTLPVHDEVEQPAVDAVLLELGRVVADVVEAGEAEVAGVLPEHRAHHVAHLEGDHLAVREGGVCGGIHRA